MSDEIAADETGYDRAKFLPDGRTRIWVDGKAYVIRLPRLKAYRVLRNEINDSVQRVVEAANQGQPVDELEQAMPFMRAVIYGNEDWEVASLLDRPMETPEDDWPTWLLG